MMDDRAISMGKVRRVLGKAAQVAGLSTLLFAAPAAYSQEPPLGSVSTSDGKVRVDVLSLKRTDGDTVTLRLHVTNTSNDPFSMTLGNSRLVDLVGRRIYSPGLTSSGCSVQSGENLACYAVFGAPPAGTHKMNVQFYEKLDLVTGVPVSEP